MADTTRGREARIRAKIDEIKREYGDGIVGLLKEANARNLHGAGELAAKPVIEGSNLRWTLSWKEKEKISFNLSVVIGVVDNGKQANIERVWVHRHASTPMDYEDHTPTSRMRRLTDLSIAGIRAAVEAEMR